MKAVVIENPGSFMIKELPDPRLGEGEIIINVKACCVCGTDIHLLDGEFKGPGEAETQPNPFWGNISQ